MYICNLTYIGQITKQNIVSNQFYAVLAIFSAPKRGGRGGGNSPNFRLGGLPPCSAAYDIINNLRQLEFVQSKMVQKVHHRMYSTCIFLYLCVRDALNHEMPGILVIITY